MPWRFEAWKQPLAIQKEAAELIMDIGNYWRANGVCDLEKEDSPHWIITQGYANRFKALAPKVPVLQEFLNILGSASEALYILQHFTRCCAAYPRMCELLYIHGPALPGKDVLLLIVQTFFGGRQEDGDAMVPYNPDVHPDALTQCLPPDYFITTGRLQSKEGPTPFLAAACGRRVIFVPEHPLGVMDMARMKDLCEQQGLKIASRGLYKDPSNSHPTFEIWMTSNYDPDLGPNPSTQEAGGVPHALPLR